VISISDNGKGFEPVSDASSDGMGGHGLASMQRRAAAIGGSLTIESKRGSGTNITLKVPLKQGTGWRRWLPTYPNGR
jgi:two-component system sensor histidine kinase DegS